MMTTQNRTARRSLRTITAAGLGTLLAAGAIFGGALGATANDARPKLDEWVTQTVTVPVDIERLSVDFFGGALDVPFDESIGELKAASVQFSTTGTASIGGGVVNSTAPYFPVAPYFFVEFGFDEVNPNEDQRGVPTDVHFVDGTFAYSDTFSTTFDPFTLDPEILTAGEIPTGYVSTTIQLMADVKMGDIFVDVAEATITRLDATFVFEYEPFEVPELERRFDLTVSENAAVATEDTVSVLVRASEAVQSTPPGARAIDALVDVQTDFGNITAVTEIEPGLFQAELTADAAGESTVTFTVDGVDGEQSQVVVWTLPAAVVPIPETPLALDSSAVPAGAGNLATSGLDLPIVPLAAGAGILALGTALLLLRRGENN